MEKGMGIKERRVILRLAFVDSMPVLMGYTTMGFVAGVLLAAKGNVVLSPLWALLTSALWVTGTMSIAGVGEIAQRTSWAAFALMTLAVNFRYAFYGFTMLSRWKDVPLLRKAYLILMLTDENYALEAGCVIRNPRRNLCYCTILSVLNHSYWVVGVVAGAVAVCALGQVVDPDRLRSWTNGMEFSMAALFLVIFTDQVRGRLTGRSGARRPAEPRPTRASHVPLAPRSTPVLSPLPPCTKLCALCELGVRYIRGFYNCLS
jgi:4-azaleucine resistance transporter AzlC